MKFNINAVNCNSIPKVTVLVVLFVCVFYSFLLLYLFASSVWFSFLYLK